MLEEHGARSSRVIEEDAAPSHEHDTDTTHLDETTPLLATNDDTPLSKPNTNVHYKNIDGRRFWFLFASILVGYVLVFFDSFFMASSHPVITSYFNASNAAAWLSTVFFLTSIIFGPFYGRISDVTGRKSMYVFAMSMFAVTTVWCGMARSIGEFIAARAFCGLGAGGVGVMSNIILSDIVKIEYRGIYQSYLNICYGLGTGLGASLGGFLADRLGWRAAFYLQVPLIVVLLVFALLATPKHLGPSLARAENKTIVQALSSFDFAGAGALTLTITGLILGINLGGSILSWTHPLVITSLVVFLVSAVGLVFVEKVAIRPLLPIQLLTAVPFGNLNWGNMLGAILASAVSFNIPLFLQGVKQVSPTKSGLLLLPLLVGGCVSSVGVGFAISRTRKIRPFIAAGILSMLGGIIACGCLSEKFPTWAIVPMIPWVGLGQGFFFPASTVCNLAMSTSDQQAVVVTTLNLSRSLGSILGVAISSWILQNALLFFLNRFVTGDTSAKTEIISRVRKSVKAIAHVDPEHRKEVIQAYALSLRVTFFSFAILAILLCLILLPVSIPELARETSEEPRKDRGESSADVEAQS